ncbi:HtaA domain-containing protein [Oerskovia sp. M15]
MSVTSRRGASGAVAVTVVAKPVAPPVSVRPGSLQWGVKESFRTYITGPVAKGGAVASAGATVTDGTFGFRQIAGGTWKAGSSTGSANYGGTVTFTGHDGLLHLTLSNPTVDVSSSDRGPSSSTCAPRTSTARRSTRSGSGSPRSR